MVSLGFTNICPINSHIIATRQLQTVILTICIIFKIYSQYNHHHQYVCVEVRGQLF